ncbi:hypothetical protein C8J56DRAFT_155862 [Mycena floridula]|nr:hypothetical protein C8J56DRAFT_155862 [Mycena floridula]
MALVPLETQNSVQIEWPIGIPALKSKLASMSEDWQAAAKQVRDPSTGEFTDKFRETYEKSDVVAAMMESILSLMQVPGFEAIVMPEAQSLGHLPVVSRALDDWYHILEDLQSLRNPAAKGRQKQKNITTTPSPTPASDQTAVLAGEDYQLVSIRHRKMATAVADAHSVMGSVSHTLGIVKTFTSVLLVLLMVQDGNITILPGQVYALLSPKEQNRIDNHASRKDLITNLLMPIKAVFAASPLALFLKISGQGDPGSEDKNATRFGSGPLLSHLSWRQKAAQQPHLHEAELCVVYAFALYLRSDGRISPSMMVLSLMEHLSAICDRWKQESWPPSTSDSELSFFHKEDMPLRRKRQLSPDRPLPPGESLDHSSSPPDLLLEVFESIDVVKKPRLDTQAQRLLEEKDKMLVEKAEKELELRLEKEKQTRELEEVKAQAELDRTRREKQTRQLEALRSKDKASQAAMKKLQTKLAQATKAPRKKPAGKGGGKGKGKGKKGEDDKDSMDEDEDPFPSIPKFVVPGDAAAIFAEISPIAYPVVEPWVQHAPPIENMDPVFVQDVKGVMHEFRFKYQVCISYLRLLSVTSPIYGLVHWVSARFRKLASQRPKGIVTCVLTLRGAAVQASFSVN